MSTGPWSTDVEGLELQILTASRHALGLTMQMAKSMMIDEIIRDTDQFVPYDTGELAESVTRLPDQGGVDYTADYAIHVARMPDSYNFNTSVHPQATPDWVEAAVKAYKRIWLKHFEENLGGAGRGLFL